MAMNALSAFFESLTTPDSEDWIVIPDGIDKIHLVCIREREAPIGRGVEMVYGDTSLAEFQQAVEQLPAKHDLGHVQVLVPKDADRPGLVKFMKWFARQADAKNFNLTSMFGPASTAEALAVLKERIDIQ